jgi:hypothetical protein
MVIRVKNLSVLLLAIIVFTSSGDNPAESKNSIKNSVGLGLYDGQAGLGGGPTISIGYQRELNDQGLRLNPNITMGNYIVDEIWGGNQRTLSVIGLETFLLFDFVRFKYLTFTVGTGGFIVGTTALDSEPLTTRSDPMIYDSYYGSLFCLGLRVTPPKSRWALEIMPINLRNGRNSSREVSFKIGFEVKI